MSVRAFAWVLLALGGGLVGASWLARGPGNELAAARAAARSLGEHDFGLLVGAQSREHEFHVVNDGDEAWSVVATDQDCGCVSVVFASSVVEPGDALVVRVQARATGQPIGALRKSVFVDVEPGPVRFSGVVSARILPEAHADPPAIEIDLAPGQAAFLGRTTIRAPRRNGDVRAVVEHVDGSLDARLGEPVTTDELIAWPLEVRGPAPSEDDASTSTVALRVFESQDDGRGVSVRLHVVARRAGSVIASPRSLVLALGDRPTSAEVFFRSRDGGGIAGLRFRTEPAHAATLDYDATTGAMRIELEPASLAELREFEIVSESESGARASVRVALTRR